MNNERKWFVIQTRPRNEKKVFEQIILKDVEVYLPRLQSVRIWSDRKKKIDVPLFPGYVFVHASEEERVNAISNTHGAIRYIMYLKRPAVVSELEIRNIQISLQVPDKVKIEDSTINIGDFVEITHGPFNGLTGYISQIRGNYKLMVSITELNTTFSVELSSSDVTLLKKLG